MPSNKKKRSGKKKKATGVSKPAAAAPAAAAAAATPSVPAPTAKQLKEALKEGGKKGQDICGIADMGGVSFFHLCLESCAGRLDLLETALEGFNKEVDPNAEDRKGGAGKLAKTLLTYDDTKVSFILHLPKELADKANVSVDEWTQVITGALGSTCKVLSKDDSAAGTVVKGEALADPTKNLFSIKMRDEAVNKGFQWLLKKKLVVPDDDSDDEIVYGDDDFPDYEAAMEPVNTKTPAEKEAEKEAIEAAKQAEKEKKRLAQADMIAANKAKAMARKAEEKKKAQAEQAKAAGDSAPTPAPKKTAAPPPKKKALLGQNGAGQRKAGPAPAPPAASFVDVAWRPAIPIGHTAFSWEYNDEDDEDDDAAFTGGAPASAPAPSKQKDAAPPQRGKGSKYLAVVNNSLKWQGAKEEDLGALSEEEQRACVQEIEWCMRTRHCRVSQGLHDRYTRHCVQRSKPVATVVSGKAQYDEALKDLFHIGSVGHFVVDKEAAASLLQQGAADGVSEAISLLGYCYEHGVGVGQDDNEAVRLYQEAAAMGDPHGKVRLARAQWFSKGGLVRDKKAVESLNKEGLAELQKRVDSGTLSIEQRSRALGLLHTNFPLLD